jgi:TPR repeat protein
MTWPILHFVRCLSLVSLALLLSAVPLPVSAGQAAGAPVCSFGSDASACEALCGSGNAEACRAAGYAYENGRGTPRDAVKATQRYRRACELGDGPACMTASNNVQFGIGTARDLKAAESLLLRSCDVGLAVGCGQVAQKYEYGWDTAGADRDPSRAESYYDHACKGGDHLSCAKLEEKACESRGGDSFESPAVLAAMASVDDDFSPCRDGTLLRMELDVTGDGKPELFLASSQSAGLAGTTWRVFSPTGAGACGYFGEMFFHYLGFRFDAARREFMTYDRAGGGEGTFSHIPVGPRGFGKPRTGKGVVANSPDFTREWDVIERWQSGPAAPVFGADLADVIQHPSSAAWTNMRTSQPASPSPLTAWACRQ